MQFCNFLFCGEQQLCNTLRQNYTLRNGKPLKSHTVGFPNQDVSLYNQNCKQSHVFLTFCPCCQWQPLLMISTLSPADPELRPTIFSIHSSSQLVPTDESCIQDQTDCPLPSGHGPITLTSSVRVNASLPKCYLYLNDFIH